MKIAHQSIICIKNEWVDGHICFHFDSHVKRSKVNIKKPMAFDTLTNEDRHRLLWRQTCGFDPFSSHCHCLIHARCLFPFFPDFSVVLFSVQCYHCFWMQHDVHVASARTCILVIEYPFYFWYKFPSTKNGDKLHLFYCDKCAPTTNNGWMIHILKTWAAEPKNKFHKNALSRKILLMNFFFMLMFGFHHHDVLDQFIEMDKLFFISEKKCIKIIKIDYLFGKPAENITKRDNKRGYSIWQLTICSMRKRCWNLLNSLL